MWCDVIWCEVIRCNGMDVMCLGVWKRCVWLRGHVMWCELGVSWGELEDDFLYSLYTTEHQCPRTTTLYFEVATKYYPVLPRISKYYKIFLRTTNTTPHFQYYKVQLPPTKCVKEYCKVQSTTTEYYSALQSTTLKYKVVKSITLLLCFWAYTSCVCNWPLTVNPCRQAHSLFF